MAKGGQYERDISVILSLWWSDNDRDDLFWRTSGSGARATVRGKKGLKTKANYGDVHSTCADSEPFTDIFVVEIKKGYNKGLSLLILIDGKQKEPLLMKWWNKLERERKQANRKYGLLIIRRDNMKPIIVMTSELLGRLEINSYEWDDDLIQIDIGKERLIIISFDKFMKWCTGNDMKLFIQDIK